MIEYKVYEYPIVFFAEAIGDHLIALPTLRALSFLFDGKVSLMALPGAYSSILSDVRFRDVWQIQYSGKTDIDWRNGDLGNPNLRLHYQTLSTRKCDLFISLSSSCTPELEMLVKELSPEVSIGIHPTFPLHTIIGNVHAFDRYFSLVQMLDDSLVLNNFAEPPTASNKVKELCYKFQRSLQNAGLKLLIVHADTKKKKMWNQQKFTNTVDQFLEFSPNFIAATVGLHNELVIQDAVNKNRVFNFCGLPLDLTFGLIGVSHLFVGVDSCMLHAADLHGIPSVGIFGPTDPKKWGFRFTSHEQVICKNLDELSEEVVLSALLKLVPLSH